MRLLFITSSRIGDAVLSSGILDFLQRQNPGIRITVACGPAAAGLFESWPGLEELIVIRKRPLALHWLELWLRSVTKPWNIVVDLRRSALSYFLICGKRYIPSKSLKDRHKVIELGDVLAVSNPPAPKIHFNDTHARKALDLLPDLQAHSYIAVAPSANWGGKIWDVENFAELLSRLTASNGILPGAKVAIFGASNEKEIARRLQSLLGNAIDLSGKIDLLTSAAIFARCKLYIGNDSGLMHVAAASGSNVLGLFGPSPAKVYAPWPSGNGKTMVVQTALSYEQLVYSPNFDYRSDQSLMGSLSVDMAEQAAIALWNKVEKEQAA